METFFTKCTIIWSIFDFLFTCFQMPWNVWLMFNVFKTLSTNVLTILYNVTLIWLLMKVTFHMLVMFHSPFENCITANVFAQNLLCLILNITKERTQNSQSKHSQSFYISPSYNIKQNISDLGLMTILSKAINHNNLLFDLFFV